MKPGRFFPLCGAALFLAATASCDGQSEEAVRAAVDRASRFMDESVSLRGGYLMMYSEDLSRAWGELPARESMVWVQDPATVGMGRVFLRAHRITGDPDFLRLAERAADVLIFGQHPSGGWHYFIDFDPTGVPLWYEQVGVRCWGWEEFYHDYGNCTFDDDVTLAPTRFLLDLYLETLDPKYRPPLNRAIQFFLDAQYPNGAWPQRFPLDAKSLRKSDPGYTAYYTFNDDIIVNNIDFMFEVHERLGDDRCLRAAGKGMEFVLLSQLPEPQAGWAQQYDLDLQPAAARSYEPVALSTLDTLKNIRALLGYYRRTGDRRFLDAVPPAIRWLEGATIPSEHTEEGHTHAVFIGIGSNLPLYGHREGTSKETGRYWNDHNPKNLLRGYGYTFNLDVEGLWREYRTAAEMTTEDLAAASSTRTPKPRQAPPAAKQVAALIEAMDDRGAWVEDLSFPNTEDYMNNPPEEFRGISTRTFINNIEIILDWLEAGGPGEEAMTSP